MLQSHLSLKYNCVGLISLPPNIPYDRFSPQIKGAGNKFLKDKDNIDLVNIPYLIRQRGNLFLRYVDEQNQYNALGLFFKPNNQTMPIFTNDLALFPIKNLPTELSAIIRKYHKAFLSHTVSTFNQCVLKEAAKNTDQYKIKIFEIKDKEDPDKYIKDYPDTPLLFNMDQKFIFRGIKDGEWQTHELKNLKMTDLDFSKTELTLTKGHGELANLIFNTNLHIAYSIDYPKYIPFHLNFMVKLLKNFGFRDQSQTLKVALKELPEQAFPFHIHSEALHLDPGLLKKDKRAFVANEAYREPLFNSFHFVLLSHANMIVDNAINYGHDKEFKFNHKLKLTEYFIKNHFLQAPNAKAALENAELIRQQRSSKIPLSTSIDGTPAQQKALAKEIKDNSSRENENDTSFYEACYDLAKQMAISMGCIIESIFFLTDRPYSFTQIPLKDFNLKCKIKKSPIKEPREGFFHIYRNKDHLQYATFDPTNVPVIDTIPFSELKGNIPEPLTQEDVKNLWTNGIQKIAHERGHIAVGKLSTNGHILYSLKKDKQDFYIHHLEATLIGDTKEHYKLKSSAMIKDKYTGKVAYVKFRRILDNFIGLSPKLN